MSELLPCPFCGSDADAVNYVIEAVAKCHVCFAAITRRHGSYDDNGLPEAIGAWNRRAPLSSATPENERGPGIEQKADQTQLPTGQGEGLREAVARLVDPEAFCPAFLANCHFHTRRETALSKADAILTAIRLNGGG